MRRTYWFGVILSSLAAGASFADEGRVPIYQPTTIASPGHYVLTRDLSASSGPVIDVQADGVDLNLNGHTITLSTATADVIRVSGSAGAQKGVTIKDGRLEGGSNAVHSLSGAPRRLVLQGLTIHGPSQNGILIDETGQVTVRQAMIDGAGQTGIVFANPSSFAPIGGANPAAAYIYDSLVRESPYDAWCLYVECWLLDNLFVDIPGPGPGPEAGIILQNAPGSMLARNVIQSLDPDPQPAIKLIASPGVSLQNNDIRGGGVATGNINDGIFVDPGSSDTMIRNNTITGCGRHGIRIESAGNQVSENVVNGNGSHGIFVIGGNNLIEWNKVGGNGGNGIFFGNASGPHAYRHNMLRGNASSGVGGAMGNTDATGNVL